MTVRNTERVAKIVSTTVSQTRFWVLGLLVALPLIAEASAHTANKINPAWSAAHQLVGAQLPSGAFAFEHDFVLGGPRPGTERGVGRLAYVTREAGTAFVLSKYFLHDKDDGVGRAIVTVLHRLAKLSLPIAKAPGQDKLESSGILGLPFGRYKLRDTLHWLGLLYRPTGEGKLVAYDRSYETAWGATTAFALLTELQFYRASHNNQFAALRQAWLKGLLVLYDGRGGFRTLPDAIDENDMSNGEIWLALAYYTRLFPDDHETADIVGTVDGYMMRTYAARSNEDFYAWGVKAAAERLRETRDSRFRQFIVRQSRAYFASVNPSADSTENSCAAVEGFATAFHALATTGNQDQDLIRRLRQRIDSEMTKNRSLQILPGQTRINLGNATYLSSPTVADYAGAFLAGTHEPYVRIDYTAHCIAALLELGNGER